MRALSQYDVEKSIRADLICFCEFCIVFFWCLFSSVGEVLRLDTPEGVSNYWLLFLRQARYSKRLAFSRSCGRGRDGASF